MNWIEQVDAHFEPMGVIESWDRGFMHRPQQAEMAKAVASAIEGVHTLVVEAGTGVGKTYAYLVPALMSGKRVLISTATKTLQEQLYLRDLPYLIEHLRLPVRVAMLKGRSSYLCLHRLDQSQLQGNSLSMRQMQQVRQVARWAGTTRTGDVSELSWLDEQSPVLSHVTSTRDNCLGTDCPRHRDCHVNLARKTALESEVVVVNHHLFFADQKLRDQGHGQLLAHHDVLIFDEAHQLNETGIQFLGDELGTSKLLEFGRDLQIAGITHSPASADWGGLSMGIELASHDWRLLWPSSSQPEKWRWSAQGLGPVAQSMWQEGLEQIRQALVQAVAAMDLVQEASAEMQRMAARGHALLLAIERFAKEPEEGRVRWVEVARGVRVVDSPLEIGAWMSANLWQSEQAPERAGRACILTSATLDIDPAMSSFCATLGLTGAQVLCLDSPFDYASCAALHIPRNVPQPSDPQHSGHVARWAAMCARILRGRTMVLTTSMRALRQIASDMETLLADTGIRVLAQGQAAKQELIRQLRHSHQEDDGVDTQGVVLVASASFWEGVDLPGAALSCVVIDKLPFPVPSDPWVQARSEQIESRGASAFREFSLPAAGVALKQGAGRLIRTESDKGLLLICDPRLDQKPYGRQLKRVLPPMKELRQENEVRQWLESLSAQWITRASTTDVP